MTHDTASSSLASMPQAHQVHAVLVAHGQTLRTQARSRRGRPTHLSWTHLCLGVLVCALTGWQSQLDLRRLLCFEGFWQWPTVPPLTDQAIYNRLDRAAGFMQALFADLSAFLRERLAPWEDRTLAPFATQVLALDESELDTVGRWLPPLRSLHANDAGLRAGRLSALFDVRLQQWRRMDVLARANVNCKVHARTMIEQVSEGTACPSHPPATFVIDPFLPKEGAANALHSQVPTRAAGTVCGTGACCSGWPSCPVDQREVSCLFLICWSRCPGGRQGRSYGAFSCFLRCSRWGEDIYAKKEEVAVFANTATSSGR